MVIIPYTEKKRKKNSFCKTKYFFFSAVTGTGLKLDVSQIKKKIFFIKLHYNERFKTISNWCYSIKI